MTTRTSRRLIACALFATTALASPAFAQSASVTAFPVRQYVDDNGVDLLSGVFNAYSPSISIGSDEMGLQYVRQVRAGFYRDTMMGTIDVSGSTYTVDIAGKAEAFALSAGVFTPVEQNGSTLSSIAGGYSYRRSDGTSATFTSSTWDFGNAAGRVITSLVYPSGKSFSFFYNEDTFTNTRGIATTGRRLQSVTSNSGYQIKFTYAGDTPDNIRGGNWSIVTNVKGLNSSIDECDPNAFTCPQTGRPELNIPVPANGVHTYTDNEGRTTQFTVAGDGVTAVRLPGSASDDITVTYVNSKVSAITRFGVTTGYAYADLNGVRTVTVTRPGGSTRVATFDLTKNVMLSDRNELGKTVGYQYDASNHPTRITLPEGNYAQLTYDARGNVTQVRRVAKAGSGLADIVTSATYPASCSNPVTCNQPTSTTDARGQVTDYAYDATHGGVLTVTSPAANTSANRPQVRIAYSRLDANGAASATGIFVPTASSTCQTGVSPGCVGTADEVKTTAAYAYGLQPSSVSSGAGNGSLTATQAMTYDVAGNLLTVDGPLSGTTDTTRYRYNLDRELIGIVGPDPDGTGVLKNRALRITFGSTGLITKQELGTTAGQTDTAWSAFSPAEVVDIGYDANRRPATQKLSSAGTSYALEQASYDTRGRADCMATRMNPAAYGSLPGACTLGTSGSDGPDRISKLIYDNASEVTQVQVGVGTSAAANERTLTYSSNGRVNSLKDGENNLTTFVYDGFDRLSKTQFPNTPKGSGTSNVNDLEQLTYDPNGNVINRRLRDGQNVGYSYDNLDRVTLEDTPSSAWGEVDHYYAYDNLGRLTTASDDFGLVMSLGHDALGRLLTQSDNWNGAIATSTYDLAGNRTKLTWRDGFFVDYDRLVTGEVSKIRENGATTGIGVLATYNYDNLGRRTNIAFGNGTSTSYTFDPVSRLASLTQNLAGTLSDLTVTISAYNPSSQIVTQSRSNDLYAWTGHGNGSTASVANGLNQLTSVGSATLTYDGRGNLTADGTTTYGYTALGLIDNAGANYYAYDPLGRLARQTVDLGSFHYDGTDMIMEGDYTNNTVIRRRYVFGPGTDEPIVWYEGSGTADRRWLHADERGSVVAVSDSAGNKLAINSYDEYGKPGAANIGRFQYTGQKWLPEVGAYDYKARLYAPGQGRFLQTDPAGYGAGPNVYNYVLGDPINLVDPLGLCPYGGPGSSSGNLDSSEISITCPHVAPDSGPPGGGSTALPPATMPRTKKPGGGGGIPRMLRHRAKVPHTNFACEDVLDAANSLENVGGKIQDFGAAASAVGFTGDLIALAFPPAEIGTGALTAAGGFIALVGTGVSAAGSGLNFVATHDIGRLALGGVNFVAGRLKASHEAHEFLRGMNIGKATDLAKALMPSRCQ